MAGQHPGLDSELADALVRTRRYFTRAAFSWYTYSPTRVRYPYVRAVFSATTRNDKVMYVLLVGTIVLGLGTTVLGT